MLNAHTRSVFTLSFLKEDENWASFQINAEAQIRCNFCVWSAGRAGTSQSDASHVHTSTKAAESGFELVISPTFASHPNHIQSCLVVSSQVCCRDAETAYLQSKRLQSCHDRSHGDQQTTFLDHLCRTDPPPPGPWDCPPVHWRAWPGPGRQQGRNRGMINLTIWFVPTVWTFQTKITEWVFNLKERALIMDCAANNKSIKSVRNHLINAINMLESAFCWSDPFAKFPGVLCNLIWSRLKHPAAANTATVWIWTAMSGESASIWTATASKTRWWGHSRPLHSPSRSLQSHKRCNIYSNNQRLCSQTPLCVREPSADRRCRTHRLLASPNRLWI